MVSNDGGLERESSGGKKGQTRTFKGGARGVLVSSARTQKKEFLEGNLSGGDL